MRKNQVRPENKPTRKLTSKMTLEERRAEMLEHVEFFKAWFGVRWAMKLEMLCFFSWGQIGRMMRGETTLTSYRLSSLRYARQALTGSDT